MVWLVHHRSCDGGRYFALKELSKARLKRASARVAEEVRREALALCMLQPHPFVVELHATFQDTDSLYLLLSLGLGGDLRGSLLRHQRRQTLMPEPTAAFYCAALVLVLEHIHGHGFAYRDLKPENVLIDSSGFPLVCDFGTAAHLGPDGRTMTTVGTWEYSAPEQLESRGCTMATDWWALGVVALECLSGSTPFPSGDQDDPLVVLRSINQFNAHVAAGNNAQAGGKLREGAAGDKDAAGASACLGQLSGAATQLVCALLVSDEATRWAAIPDIRGQSFFGSIDWEALRSRRLMPPAVPTVLGEADTRNFSHCNLDEPDALSVGAPLMPAERTASDAAACESPVSPISPSAKRPRAARLSNEWKGFA